MVHRSHREVRGTPPASDVRPRVQMAFEASEREQDRMFETLQERLSGIFDKLTGRGSLSEADVDAAMREVRRALIEADVALEVVRSFTEQVRQRAIGQEVLRSIKPGQMVVKIVHDAMVDTLGREAVPLDLKAAAPVTMLMVGLQGSGKTTTTAKIAKRLAERERKRVLMASLDVARPAAQEQLAVLGRQTNVDTLPIVPGQPPVEIVDSQVQSDVKTGEIVRFSIKATFNDPDAPATPAPAAKPPVRPGGASGSQRTGRRFKSHTLARARGN